MPNSWAEVEPWARPQGLQRAQGLVELVAGRHWPSHTRLASQRGSAWADQAGER